MSYDLWLLNCQHQQRQQYRSSHNNNNNKADGSLSSLSASPISASSPLYKVTAPSPLAMPGNSRSATNSLSPNVLAYAARKRSAVEDKMVSKIVYFLNQIKIGRKLWTDFFVFFHFQYLPLPLSSNSQSNSRESIPTLIETTNSSAKVSIP
jgi:hypothetical protein